MMPRLTIALACLLAVTASAATAKTPNRSRCATTCVYMIHVGSKPRDWRTPWASAKDDAIAITVSIDGQELPAEDVNDREARYYGHGTVVKVTAPSAAGAIRLRLATVADRGVDVRVRLQRTRVESQT